MKIIKRDGRLVPFEKEKIQNAILKAFIAVDGEPTDYAITKANNIAEYIAEIAAEEVLTVEKVQDLVEKGLMATKRKDAAKAYILYRDQRTKVREQKSQMRKAAKERLNATNVQNSNANVDERSFSGREKESSADVHKIIALEDILSEEISKAHKEMLLYQHDLEKTPIGEHNCLNIDFEKLFTEGFSTRNGDIRPPSSFSTACQQMAVIFQCQSQVQFGGVGTVHIDYDLAPFVKNSFRKHFIINMIKDCEDILKLDFANMSNEEIDEWIFINKILKDSFRKNFINKYKF